MITVYFLPSLDLDDLIDIDDDFFDNYFTESSDFFSKEDNLPDELPERRSETNELERSDSVKSEVVSDDSLVSKESSSLEED